MFARLMQATTITLALYVLLGVNDLQQTKALQGNHVEATVEPAEALVAIKQALIRRQ